MASEAGFPPHGCQRQRDLNQLVGFLSILPVIIIFTTLLLIVPLLRGNQPVVFATAGTLAAGTALLTGGIVHRDARTVIPKTDWETGPLRWGILTMIVPIVGSAMYLLRRNTVITETRQQHFEERCTTYDQQLSRFESRLQPYFDVRSYLSYHEHDELTDRYHQHHTEYEQIADTAADTRGIETNGQLNTFEQRLEAAREILSNRHGYNDRFVDRELERRDEFFSDVGEEGYSLNRRQREAVVRNDTYNRVIAGAGTGKTLVLTTRVAYLIKYQDVPPDDILVATYTENATEEMAERLKRDFGISGVEVITLHSFGNGIIKQLPRPHQGVFNRDDRDHFVRDVINRETEPVLEKFYDHLAGFLLYRDIPAIEERDFETREEYVRTLQRKTYETLRGEEVKSRAEKIIADFLHTHQVDYRYEHRAEPINAKLRADDTGEDAFDESRRQQESADKGAYRPDFYIPSADLYLEHFGIDEAGEVPKYFTTTSEEYVEKIHWAREQFAEADATLTETYQFEFDVGKLRKALTHRLTHHDVSLDRMEHTELVNETYEMHEQRIPVWKQLSRFIELARVFQIEPGEIPARLSASRPAQYHFGMCGGLLLHLYEDKLVETQSVDFPDMIYETTQNYEAGSEVVPEFDHVLVDEFQDIGQDQLHLVEALTGPDHARLFAVGDDWQSIYSFQGAVVDLFIDFEQYFGPTATTTLKTNYRSPAQLVNAGATLIQHNDGQLEKDITAESAVTTYQPPSEFVETGDTLIQYRHGQLKTEETAASEAEASVVTHRLGGYNEHSHVELTAKLAVRLTAAYLEHGCAPSDIMILCRYDSAVPYLDAVRRRLTDHGIPCTDPHSESDGDSKADDNVIVESVHQVKGREADHVIVTHVSEGGMGFPATDRNAELLEPVQAVPMNTMAEERRLFYVAISRSIRTLDIITKAGQESRFIDEIGDYVDRAVDANDLVNLDADSDVDEVSARVAHLWDETDQTVAQKGILEDETDSIQFVSWANADPPMLEEDTWYRFEGINLTEYNGEPQVQLKRWTTASETTPENERTNIEELHQHLTATATAKETESD